jgi:hypothetical protein
MKSISQLFGKRQNLSNYGMWYLLFAVAGAISAADSIYVLYFPMKLQFEASFGDPTIAFIVAMFVCASYLLIVDISLMRFLPNTLAGIFNKNVGTGIKSNLGKLYWGTLLFCVLQTAATIFVSFHLRHSSVEISAQAPVTTDIKALAEGQNAAQKEKIAAAEATIKRLKAEKEKAVNNVPQKAAKMQEWGKGGSYVERMNAYKSAQKAAEASNKAAKAAAGSSFDRQLQEAEKAKSGVLNDPTLLAAISAADTLNRAALKRHELKTASFSDFLLIMSLASTVVVWFAGCMMGFHFAAFNIGSIENLVPGASGNYSGGASVALSAPTITLPTDYTKYTSELIAVHEAGHLCAYAYMNAISPTSDIDCLKISTEPDGSTGALGYVQMNMQYDETDVKNIQLLKQALVAGVAAEYVAVGTGSPESYLAKAGYSKGTTATDYTQFEALEKYLKGDDFQTTYLKVVELFKSDSAMLKMATAEILSKKTIQGADIKHLFSKIENWYRSKLGKKLKHPTHSVETEKPVITEEKPVITEEKPLEIFYLAMTGEQKKAITDALMLEGAIDRGILSRILASQNPTDKQLSLSSVRKMLIACTNEDFDKALGRLLEKNEMQKPVITEETTVITEKQEQKQFSSPIELEITQPSNESWLSNLKTIEVENETYTPNDLITAKSYILTYWSRAFSSKSDAKKEENREKALRFKTVLEMTGLTVELFDNGKGKVTF